MVKPTGLDGKIVTGKKVSLISKATLLKFAVKISRKLALYPFTMLKFSPKMLLNSIEEGRTVMYLRGGDKLLAFGQIWYYGKNKKGQKVYEFGSWLSFGRGGYGRKILEAVKDLANDFSPKPQLIAIVESNNNRVQKILRDFGGVRIGYKYSKYLKTQSGISAYMAIYDITKR